MHRAIQGMFIEHSRQRLHTEYTDDKKYAFMSRHGGPGAGIFIPYNFSHIPVKIQIHLALESREIQLYPKHLNKEQQYKRSMVKKGRPVNSKHAARAAGLPRANWSNRGETPVRLQLMHGSGLTPNKVATDLSTSIQHSSDCSISLFSLLLSVSLPTE